MALLIMKNKCFFTTKGCSSTCDCGSPIFGGVDHSGYQLHGFRVVLRLRVQTQVVLHKVSGGHVMLSILQHAGILQRRQRCQHWKEWTEMLIQTEEKKYIDRNLFCWKHPMSLNKKTQFRKHKKYF